MGIFNGARAVATAAAVGNLLQGWDNAAVAGALLYIRPEYKLEGTPATEGLVVAAALIGAVASVIVAGPAADWLGRRTMLCISGLLFSLAAAVMAWAPTVHALIVGRLLVGYAIGLAATVAPILISESSPAEIRGQLATLPQLMGSLGLVLAYAMNFALSLQPDPDWRIMLGSLFVPSLVYVLLGIFVLPESPRWLVSKGRMLDAKLVLQNLRGQEDVSAELALLVEGLGVVHEAHLEEWLVRPAEKVLADGELHFEEGQFELYGPDETMAWVATPIIDETGSYQHHHGLRRALSADLVHNVPLIDPMVTLLGSVQNNVDPFFIPSHDNNISEDDHHKLHDHWDEEAPETPRFRNSGYHSDTEIGTMAAADMDDDDQLQSPLLTQSNYGSGRYNNIDSVQFSRHDSHDRLANFFSPHLSRAGSRRSTIHDSAVPDMLGSVGIGGGWQLAWQKTGEGEEGALKRVFLKSEGGDMSHYNSTISLPGVTGNFLADNDTFQAAVLVTKSSFDQELFNEHAVGPAMVHPVEHVTQGPPWSNLLEGGVQRALIVGVGIQILQQFSGINAMFYFTPQILMQAGTGDLLASMGIDEESSSILASGVMCLPMLPCVVVAMWLMDISGRRQLLLATIPVLAISLVMLVLVNMFLAAGLLAAAISFTCVTLFICSFVTGFGPIPNILCSEIFPTSVRGLCIGICAAAMWTSNVIVTYSFPLIAERLGLQGVFGLFAVVSIVSWIFVFLKVPETKGFPLEVISEFFAVAPLKKEEYKSADYKVLHR